MRGQRILEVPGVADQRPPWSRGALDESAKTAEPSNAFDLTCRRNTRVELRRGPANQAAIRRRRVVPVSLISKTVGRHRHAQTRRAMIRGNGAQAHAGLIPPVIPIEREIFPIAIEERG